MYKRTTISLVSLLVGILLVLPSSVFAQEENEKSESSARPSVLNDIQLIAYIQGQYQFGQKDAYRLGVGDVNEKYGEESFSRIGLRRAYVSTLYERGIVYGLITMEVKDRKISFSDAYLTITDPWTKSFSFSTGSINTLFGYELSISPSSYEVLEGTGFIYNLFPDIFDIGARLSYQAPSKIGSLKVDLALVAGNGINQETDSKRDFVGSITASTNRSNTAILSGGVSYYYGHVYQGTSDVYKMQGNQFVLDSSPNNIGSFAKRQYFDLNAQVALKSAIGLSELRGEYIWGTQPGGLNSNESPNSGKRATIDTYIRDFNGGYLYYLQQIGPKLPLTFFGGYSWYDPNTKVAGNDVGLNNTNVTDLRYQTVNLGLIWFPYPSIRIQAFYEIPMNEKSTGLIGDGFDKDKQDNIFSLRVQYKF